MTVRQLLAFAKVDHVDLVKMDIEGAEIGILECLSQSDFEVIDQLSVEFHDFIDPGLHSKSQECVKKLENLGYTLFRPHSANVDCLFFKATPEWRARMRSRLAIRSPLMLARLLGRLLRRIVRRTELREDPDR